MKNSIETILSQSNTQPRRLALVTTKNGDLAIEETNQYRWIRDNFNAYYSILDKSSPERLVLPYLQTMMAALLFLPEPKSTLVLGAGGGAILRFFSLYLSKTAVKAVDNDKNIIEMTERYFSTDSDSQCIITNSDATEIISTSSINQYELILVDLFSHGTIPDFFNELSFYENCKKKLATGIAVFNLIIETEENFKLILKLLLSVFNNKCLCLTVPNYKNIIVLTFSDDFIVERDVSVLSEKCENLQGLFNIDFSALLNEIEASNVIKNNTLTI